MERATRELFEIKENNVNIYIDDFGTGYASLGLLNSLPIDTLKIDRSFIRDMVLQDSESRTDNRRLVQTVVDLAHNLGMRVVAEGIEMSDQLQLLQHMQCDLGQGYLFDRPLSAEAATVRVAGIKK